MTERARLNEVDRVPVPDLWDEVTRRAAQPDPGLSREWSTPSRPWHRGATAVITLALFAVAAATLWAAFVSGPGDPTGGRRRASVPGPQHVDPRVVAEIAVPGVPGPIAIGEGSIWVRMDDRNEKLVRIDPNSNEIVAEIQLPRTTFSPAAVVVAGGSVWAASDAGLVRVDPATNTVSATIPGILAVYDYGFGSVWAQAVDGFDTSIVRIDPLTNQVTASIPFDDPPEAVVVGEGAVWVNERIAEPTDEEGTLLRIDPASNDITRIDVLTAGYLIAAGGGRVWVPTWVTKDYTSGFVVIDAETNRPLEVSAEIEHFAPFTVGAGGVWLFSDGICRMDPRSLDLDVCIDPGRIQAPVIPPPAALDPATDTIWAGADRTVVRIALTEPSGDPSENAD